MLRSEPVRPRCSSLALAILVHVAVGGLVFLFAASRGRAEGPHIVEGPPPLPPVRGPRVDRSAGGSRPTRQRGPKVIASPRPPERLPELRPEPVVEELLADLDERLALASDLAGDSGGSGAGIGDAAGDGQDPSGGGGGFGPGGDPGVGPHGDHAAARPVSSEPMIIRGDMVPPRLIHEVEPEYPRLARGRVQGTVILRCIIDADGHVRVEEVLKPVGLLTESAIEAVESWRYEPALWNGRPQAVFQTVRVTFR